MMEKYVVPLIIVQEMGTIVGKTRLQKVACLVEAKARQANPLGTGLAFTLHLHGPFSRELASLVDGWVKGGILEEQLNFTPAGHPQYSYYLSDRGSLELRTLVKQIPHIEEFRSIIREVVKESGALPLPSLVTQAYAAYSEMEALRGPSIDSR